MQSAINMGFRCVCCEEVHPDAEAHYDQQFEGPVCNECKRNCLWATARLKLAGIDRPLINHDLNEQLYARFASLK